MNENPINNLITAPTSDNSGLTEKQFSRLATEIYALCGIHLPDTKKLLVEGRLHKRMKLLGYHSYEDYLDYLFSIDGYNEEYVHLIDVMTTNKTDFFRENHHFEFLSLNALPQIEHSYRYDYEHKRLIFWSAGCSSGEEPYSLSIVLKEYFGERPRLNFSVLASDISTEILKTAFTGIYEAEKIESIPDDIKCRYFLKSKDQAKQLVRVSQVIRNLVEFKRINFLEAEYDVPDNIDCVFCRNVLIYFDRITQETVLKRICNKIGNHGYLFLGHSETISGMNLPLSRLAPTIYQKI